MEQTFLLFLFLGKGNSERARVRSDQGTARILILEEVVSVGDTAVEGARDSAQGLNMAYSEDDTSCDESALWNWARGRLRCLFGKLRCATRYYLPTPLPNNFPSSFVARARCFHFTSVVASGRVRLITSVYVDNQASPHFYQ